MMRDPECGHCPVHEAMARRAFLRDAAAAGLAALGALGLAPARLVALPVHAVRGVDSRLGKVYPLPRADGVFIDRDESAIIARAAGKVFAFSLACPHQNTALRWEERHGRFQCPKHKSRYRPDGTFIEGRATRGLDRFAVTREGEQLLVNFEALYRQDEHPARWAAAFVEV